MWFAGCCSDLQGAGFALTVVDLFWRFQKNPLREERGRARHGLPGAAAPGAVPHSARTRASGWVRLGTGVLGAVLRGPHCPVMASALTVLLGCWLAGWSGVWGEPSYPKPNITLIAPEGLILGRNISILCEGLHWGMQFDLNKDGRHFRSVLSTGSRAAFPFSNVSWAHGGIYNCSYHNQSAPRATSSPSDPLELVVRDESNWPGLAIIAGVSVAAAGLLLLLVAFVCFRRTRARKGAAPRPSSTSPMGALKAPAQQDLIYASINEGNETQTLESNPEGLTYAELDGRALQAKRGGPAPAPEPALYATVNVSRGAPQ